MKQKTLFRFAVLTACSAATTWVGPGASADEPAAARQKASAAVDLARASAGARLQVFTQKGSAADAQTLIGDDAASSYSLAAGTTSVVLTLPKIEVLNRFNFISYEAAGQMNVSVSSVKLPADSADWRAMVKSQPFAAQQVNACALGSVEARYIKVDFNAVLPGRIANVGLFGLPTVAAHQQNGAAFDLASLSAGANVVAVSHGGNPAAAQAILDGNAETSFAFDPADPAPTVVVDLGARRALDHLSCVYQAPAGQLDFYLADSLSAAKETQAVSLNYLGAPQDTAATVEVRAKAANRAVLASVQTTGKPGVQQASADFGGQTGRYLIAAFHPKRSDYKDYKDRPQRDFKEAARDYKDFKDTATAADTVDREPAPSLDATPFKLTAFSVFGQRPGGSDTIQNPQPVPPPNGGSGVPSQPPISPPGAGGGIVSGG